MNSSNPNPKKLRKPLPKIKVLCNSDMRMRGGAGAAAPNTYTCNPCVQTENDRCFYTKGIC
jgi:hypothetical protein